jgi:hypothetical protein
MLRLVLAIPLLAALGGCTGAEILFSASARQEMVDNVEGAAESQQLLTEYVYAAARGDVPLDDVVYDAPSAENGYVGTITATGGAFAFGTGDLSLQFTCNCDEGYVDPFDPLVDLSDDGQVVLDIVAVFDGISNLGASLRVAADVLVTTVTNGEASATTTLDGSYDIDHAGYDVDLLASNLAITFDHTSHQVTYVTGELVGEIDIPDFAFDVDVALVGAGTAIQVGLDFLDDSIHYTRDLY